MHRTVRKSGSDVQAAVENTPAHFSRSSDTCQRSSCPDCVQVVDFGTERGRALVITRPIRDSEALFRERPLICCQFSWNRHYGYRACDYCLQPLESPTENACRLLKNSSFILPQVSGAPDPQQGFSSVNCPVCGVAYCSEACQEASKNEYHSFICTRPDTPHNVFDRLEEEWRSSHYPPETGTVMLLVRIAAAHFSAHIRGDARAQDIITALSRFVSSLNVDLPNSAGGDGAAAAASTSLTHKMLGPKFSGSLARLHALFVEALGEMSRRAGSLPDSTEVLHSIGLQSMLTEYGFCSAMCLIGRNGQGIGTTALGAWGNAAEAAVIARAQPLENREFSDFLDSLYEKLDQTAGEFLDNEGVGLYKRQSLINHSCEPNACVRFESGTNELSVVANEELGPGTEVTICYFDECMLLRGVHSRRRYLREHYLFQCQCPRCVREKQAQLDSGVTSETSSSEDQDEEEGMDE